MNLKQIRIGAAVGLLMVLAGWPGPSRTRAGVEQLALAQAVELALQNDYQVKSDANSLEKAKLAVRKEALNIYPQATVDGQFQYGADGDSYPQALQIVVKETIPTSRNLYGRKIVSGIEAAMWDQVICEATVQISKADVIYTTYEYYFNVLKAQRVMEIQTGAVGKYRSEYDLANRKLRLGKITKPDQLKVEILYHQAEYDLEKDRSDLEIARLKLANQLGLQDFSGYDLEEVDLEVHPAVGEVDALRERAFQKRLELQKSEITIKKSQRTADQAKNGEYPTLTFSYNDQRETQSLGMSYDFLSGDFTWLAAQKVNSYQTDITARSSTTGNYFGDANKYFTLKLSWTLDFGGAANEIKQAGYTLKNAKLDWEKERVDIGLEVKEACLDYQLAVKSYDLYRKNLAAYEKDMEIKELQMKMGAITYSDYTTAQKELLEARIEAVEAGYDRELAYQKLQKVTGNLYPFDRQPVTGEKNK